jgi:hypothetical protein
METKPSTNGLKQSSFSPFVEEYIQNLHRFGLDRYIGKVRETEIQFADLDEGTAGVCYYLINRVEIDRRFWEKAKLYHKDELIMHELGHCVLNYEHDAPPSIMQAAKFLGISYVINYQKYVNEYFGCKTGDCIKLHWDEERYK